MVYVSVLTRIDGHNSKLGFKRCDIMSKWSYCRGAVVNKVVFMSRVHAEFLKPGFCTNRHVIYLIC